MRFGVQTMNEDGLDDHDVILSHYFVLACPVLLFVQLPHIHTQSLRLLLPLQLVIPTHGQLSLYTTNCHYWVFIERRSVRNCWRCYTECIDW